MPHWLALAAPLLLGTPASAPSGEPLPEPQPQFSVRAHGTIRNAFSKRDYPASARRLRQQGSVTYEFRVGPDGRVDRCRILVSSGVPVLDETTCRLLRERVRLIPARDRDGKPTFDTLTGIIHWRR
jgi:protein TonB